MSGDQGLAALQDRVRTAVEARAPLRIRGGGTKDFYGGDLVGEVLPTTGHAGIVDYEPNELVLTARAGTPLATIERTLRASGQMLAFEPPRFGSGGTLGGAIASGLSGPRRPYAGAARDFILGVRVIDGTGEDLGFGGRVMKNVAGFDVSRLMTGALGTLGVITEVSLKCLPLPKSETTVAFACAADEAIRKTNDWAGQPLPLSGTCYHDGMLRVRLSGAAPAVNAALTKIGGDVVTEDEAFWASVRDQTHSFFASAQTRSAALWRLSVKATAPYTDLSGEQLIEWGGALRWLIAANEGEPQRLRAWASSHGGHATLYRARDKSCGAFQPISQTMHTLHQRLKITFDPHGVFNRGRLYPL